MLAFARFHRLSLPKKATISERSSDIIIDESPNVKLPDEKKLEKSGSTRHSVANDGGFRSSDPHKEELWAKFIVKIANANYINPGRRFMVRGQAMLCCNPALFSRFLLPETDNGAILWRK